MNSDKPRIPAEWRARFARLRQQAGTASPPLGKEAISLRVDADVLAWFRRQGPRYQTRMNAVLRAHVQRALASGAALLLLAAAPVTAQSDAALVGLWGIDTVFGPGIRGPIVITGTGPTTWVAKIAGSEVPSQWTGHGWSFSFPDSSRLDVGVPVLGRPLAGFWIQPRGNLGWHATPVPVTLVWSPQPVLHGNVEPLDDRMSMYLDIAPGDSGTLRAIFRNPQRGWTGGSRWFRAVEAGQNLDLIDPGTGKTRFQQPYDAAKRTITIDFGSPFTLVPLLPAQASRYLPVPPGTPPYSYRMPVAKQDGWTVTSAASAGMSDSMLAALVRRIVAVDVNDPTAPLIHSVLVARKGKLILEEYFFGFTADETHDLRSASKTFTGLMAGIAIDQGEFTIDTPVYSALASAGANDDPRRAKMTVGHLLSHTSGLACDDNDEGSPGNEERLWTGVIPDWYGYTLSLPMANDPGRTYAYCTAGINLAGAMVAKTSGMSLLDYFYQKVSLPMQMGVWHMSLMPDGSAFAGGGLYLRPRDFLKLGQMYLNGGTWNGTRVVSRKWVERSTMPRATVPDSSHDGYTWHLHTLTLDGRRYREYDASGNGGQLVIVLPELDIVVAFTAGNYNRYPIWRTFRDELVPQYVIGALKSRS